MGFVLSIAHNLDKAMVQSMMLRGVPKATCEELNLVSTQSSICIAGMEQCRVFAVCRDRAAYRLASVLAWWGRAGGEAIFGSLGAAGSVSTNLSESLAPNSLWLSTWTCLHTTKAMDLFFRLLVEMDIVEAYEWDYFYWYWDFVCSAYSHALDKLQGMRQEHDVSSHTKDTANASKSKRHPQQTVSSPFPYTVFADDLVLKGRGFLCKGMFRVAILLKKLKLLTCPPLSRAVVFSKRFAVFEEILSPSPLAYSDFVDTVYRGNEFDLELVDSCALATSAATCFQNAKKCFDEARRSVAIADDSLAGLLGGDKCHDEAMALTKVAVAYSLELTKLSRSLQASPQQPVGGRVQWNHRYHPHFPVMAIGGV